MNVPDRLAGADQRDLRQSLEERSRRWLVSGVAGFIGSNLLEFLLMMGQQVVGLDNFSAGHRLNLKGVEKRVGEDRWRLFRMIEGDIRDRSECERACAGVEIALHQAAIASVPHSFDDPLACHDTNVTGFLNVLDAALNSGVAPCLCSLECQHGDADTFPAPGTVRGRPLSPYALSKNINEDYAELYAREYGMKVAGLRYFNVFGPRQDPHGLDAAVIPKWIAAMHAGNEVSIYGDGETARDFCYITNAVQANLRAALYSVDNHAIYNVAVCERTTLNDLFSMIDRALRQVGIVSEKSPRYTDFRTGDVRASVADLIVPRKHIAYSPSHSGEVGIRETVAWYTAKESDRAGPCSAAL